MQTRLSTTQQQHQQFRQQLRQHIRKTRRNLTALQQQQAAQRITQQALSFIEQHQAQHIALYLAVLAWTMRRKPCWWIRRIQSKSLYRSLKI